MADPTPSRSSVPAAVSSLLILIAYLGFISLGLPDTLIGVAWPSVRGVFGRQQSEIAWIFFGSGAAYFCSSLLTGRLMRLMSIGLLLAGSSGLVAAAMFGYGTASVWVLFAACALLHGLGSGAIDSALNFYVAHHLSARHMNWLHACYSLGATLGPIIMTAVLVQGNSWRAGYLTVGTLLALLALLFAASQRQWGRPGASGGETLESTPIGLRETLRYAPVWVHVVLFFIYTGLEVTVGQWSFTLLTEARGLPKELAGTWVTLYWGSIAAGRIGFGFIVERLGVDRLLRLAMLATTIGAALFLAHLAPWLTAIALVLIGLGLAPIFPCLMVRTPQRLGPARAAHAIGVQVSAAMVGAAALPSACGFLVQRLSLSVIPAAALAMALALFLLHEGLLRHDRRVPQA